MKKIKQTRTVGAILAVVMILLISMPAFAGIQDIGTQDSQLSHSSGNFSSSISSDGSTVSIVMGLDVSMAPWTKAFRWTAGSGAVALDIPINGDSMITAISANGSTVVGQLRPEVSRRAFRWTPASGETDLGSAWGNNDYGTTAYGVSENGSAVVGQSGLWAFRWTPASGMVILDDAPSWEVASSATAASADGSVAVGWINRSFADGVDPSEFSKEAFRWTANGGMVRLGFLPSGGWSEATATSPDGLVVVGASNSPLGTEAFRWTADGGMIGLGEIPGFGGPLARDTSDEVSEDGGGVLRPIHGGGLGVSTFSRALALSADGSVIVGYGTSNFADRAFLWTAADGMRALDDVLEADFGFDMTGWTLDRATSISADGKTIVGYGHGPAGRNAWIVTLPEPSSVVLLAFGSLAVLKRKG